ncbi:MAG TPA: helix-turn-helix domain-containing protein [Methylomirabilota bacterium]|nr:helix-turn-helix domain-containing protein [Methylomirabilota bacterium]
MREVQRMSAEERKAAIGRAVLPLFARKGFANTTTRELAEVAGVSEALLYKHFPSKETLYLEIQNLGCKEGDPLLEKLAKLEPSTSTLIHIVYYLMRAVAFGKPCDGICWETRHRLTLNSLLDDGAFIRLYFQKRFECCYPTIQACLRGAQAAGDLVESPVSNENRLRFAHHLATAIALMHLPKMEVIDYKVSKEDLMHQAVWFVLRGMGLQDGAISAHYNAKALALFFEANGG